MKRGKPPVWILIDGQNTVHRDAYGAGVTRAAETLSRRIDLMDKQWGPSCIITAWDTGGPTFRHELFPGYKGERKRLDGIAEAIEATKEMCHNRNIAVMESPGFEADDLIATLTDEARGDGYNVMIYSGDKDLHQLLRVGEVSQLTSMRRQFGKIDCGWVTADSLQAKYSIRPDQWVEYKMLVGDPSDAITGVAGIGHEIAAQVLKDCDTLDRFYKSPFQAAISPRSRATLMRAKPRLQLLRDLCTLRRDVPLPELWKEGV